MTFIYVVHLQGKIGKNYSRNVKKSKHFLGFGAAGTCENQQVKKINQSQKILEGDYNLGKNQTNTILTSACHNINKKN